MNRALIANLLLASLAEGSLAGRRDSLPHPGDQLQRPPTKTASAPSAGTQAEFDRLKAQAEAKREADEVAEAIRLYAQLVKLRPDWAEGWWYLGTLNYERDQYGPGAEAFRRYTALEPKNGQGWGFLGLCEYKINQLVSSLQHLAKSRALGFSGNEELARVVRYHQAVLLTRGLQFEAAQAILNGFAVEHRESAAVVDGLGQAVLRIPEPFETLGNERKEMIRGFGKAAFLAGERRLPEARKQYEELEARYQGQPNVAYAIGVSWLTDKDPDKAMEYFERELQRDPRHLPALLQVALHQVETGRVEEALPFALKAAEVMPESFAAHYTLGRIYLASNQVAKSITELERAALLAPGSSSVRFVLARAYGRAKRPADAARARAEFARLEAIEKTSRGEATGESGNVLQGPDSTTASRPER